MLEVWIKVMMYLQFLAFLSLIRENQEQVPRCINQSNPKMEQNFFANLPTEMTMNILSRLPVVSTMSCKCVCKSWLALLETPEFVRAHLSKAVPGLAVFEGEESSKPYRFYDFVDELDPEYPERNCKLAFNFSFPSNEIIHSSVNGLLLMVDQKIPVPKLFICNPITRDYVTVPQPPNAGQVDTFGFGVSRTSGQYKVVRIFHESVFKKDFGNRAVDQSQCQVYTLGTGSWRSVAPGAPCKYECRTIGTFLNGNFHWLVYDYRGFPWVSCFDLETERFGYFTPPYVDGCFHVGRTLSTLRGCLCLCDNSSKDVTVTWLMSSYGDVRTWTRLFIISKSPNLSIDFHRGVLCPIKIFKDGDIVIAEHGCCKILCYSNKFRTLRRTGVEELYGGGDRSSAISYTPSFISLKTFTTEKLSSY